MPNPDDIKALGRRATGLLTSTAASRQAIGKLTQRGAIPRRVWHHLPPGGLVDFELPGGESVSLQLPDTDGVARELQWVGVSGAEAATIDAIYTHARQARTILDIGANVGLYTVIAALANPDAKVVAFEPVPSTFAVLGENLARNGLTDLEHHNIAVGAESGTASFHVPYGDCPSSASFDESGFRGLDGEVVEVDVVTIDEIIAGDDPVDFVKIDVEGFEPLVLEGMTATIERCHPAIVLESNYDGPADEVAGILHDHGYEAAQLRPEGPRVVTSIRTTPDEAYRNFVFTHPDAG